MRGQEDWQGAAQHRKTARKAGTALKSTPLEQTGHHDMLSEPHQWRNLARKPEFAAQKEKLKKWLPKTNANHFRGNQKGLK
jgi:hypothetical protein